MKRDLETHINSFHDKCWCLPLSTVFFVQGLFWHEKRPRNTSLLTWKVTSAVYIHCFRDECWCLPVSAACFVLGLFWHEKRPRNNSILFPWRVLMFTSQRCIFRAGSLFKSPLLIKKDPGRNMFLSESLFMSLCNKDMKRGTERKNQACFWVSLHDFAHRRYKKRYSCWE